MLLIPSANRRSIPGPVRLCTRDWVVEMLTSTSPSRMKNAVEPKSPSLQMGSSSLGLSRRRTTAPSFLPMGPSAFSRKRGAMPSNSRVPSGQRRPSSTSAPTGSPGILASPNPLFVSAPVGQDTMHSPHDTQVDSPMTWPASNVITVALPLPARPMTLLCATSVHARTQRSHTMHAAWSTAMFGCESSCGVQPAIGGRLGGPGR